MDPQDGIGDTLDQEWEEEQRRDMAELNQSISNSSPGCLAFLKRSRRGSRNDRRRIPSPTVTRPSYNVDYANPGERNNCTRARLILIDIIVHLCFMLALYLA